MGTWSIEAFGNDTAADWLAALIEGKDPDALESALDRVVFREIFTASKDVEARDAELALAAAALLALWQGGSGDFGESEAARHWAAERRRQAGDPPAELLAKAEAALHAVLSRSSELAALWRETDDYRAWRLSVRRLRDQLGAG